MNNKTLIVCIKSTSSTSFQGILALKAAGGDRNIKINSDPIFRDLIIRHRSANVLPINASITSTILEHQPQRLSGFGIVRAASTARERKGAPRQVPAEIASTVAGGITVLGKVLAEHGLGLNDDVVFAAVEEHVFVLRRELEVGAGVQAEGPRAAKLLSVLAAPHEGVRDHHVRIAVAQVANWVSPRRGSELQLF
ncbi:hypothetical protein CR513_50104, partial [Mucuna pruriens]